MGTRNPCQEASPLDPERDFAEDQKGKCDALRDLGSRKNREKQEQRSRMKANLAVYYVLVVAGTLGLVLTIKIGDRLLPAEAMGLLLLARRFSVSGAFFLQLGTSQTLLRYVSIHHDNELAKRRYALLSVLVWLVLLAICLPLAYGLQDALAHWWYPDSQSGGGFALWTVFLMLSMVAIFVAHSVLLAEQRMALAGIVSGMEVSGLLLLGFLILNRNATPLALVQYQALGATGLSAVVLVVYLCRSVRATSAEILSWKHVIGDFIQYGLSRGLITTLDMSVLVIGPWLIRSNAEEAGFLVIALTMLRIVQALIGPVTKVASATTARFVAEENEAMISESVRLLFGVALYVSAFIMALMIPWRHYLIQLWLDKPETIEGTWLFFSSLCWGILPLAVYYGLRGVIEVRWVTPFNLYTLLAAVAANIGVYYIAVSYLGQSLAVRLSILSAVTLMGALTVVWVRSYVRPFSYWGLPRLAIVTGLVAAANVWAAQYEVLCILLAALIVSVGVTILALFVCPSPFVGHFRKWIGLPRKKRT